MNASSIVHELETKGVRFEVTDNPVNLRVIAPPGTLSDTDKTFLKESKDEVMQLLIRHRLEHMAHQEGIETYLIARLPKEDIAACVGLSDSILKTYLHALHESHLRQQGITPPDETATAHCRRCGEVPVAPEVAAVAPKVNGVAQLSGCPWCHVKRS